METVVKPATPSCLWAVLVDGKPAIRFPTKADAQAYVKRQRVEIRRRCRVVKWL